jgi:hypothetical protein
LVLSFPVRIRVTQPPRSAAGIFPLRFFFIDYTIIGHELWRPTACLLLQKKKERVSKNDGTRPDAPSILTIL